MLDTTKDRTADFASRLAKELHKNQTDKSGMDYFRHHVWDVARRTYEATRQVSFNDFRPYTLASIGLLHDVIEDTAMTAPVLRDLFDENIVDAVVALSRGDQQFYPEYIDQVCENAYAIEVKIHDIHSNLNPKRLHELDGKTQRRLVKKYTNALRVLYEARTKE